MLFYFHGGDLPAWMLILFLLFVTLVPLGVILLVVFATNDYMKWKKEKENKDRNPSATQY